jgi:hypothetical protein
LRLVLIHLLFCLFLHHTRLNFVSLSVYVTARPTSQSAASRVERPVQDFAIHRMSS